MIVVFLTRDDNPVGTETPGVITELQQNPSVLCPAIINGGEQPKVIQQSTNYPSVESRT